jgi:hypothetical protein
MSIDPTGTSPGLIPGAQAEPKTLNMKCVDERCGSMEATEIQLGEKVRGAPAPSQRVYRCVKCGRTRSLTVGGNVDF